MRKTLVSLTSAVAFVGALFASSAAVQASPYYGGHHNHHNHHSGPGPVRCLAPGALVDNTLPQFGPVPALGADTAAVLAEFSGT